ncbi:FtsH protease activity modulator HflK [Rhodoferax sp.]|jgi:membrane protease subunit HflK|uniref:FtsH protease activity modulator HflK n=1 Tax=Rhodoferax sp. TaxID=50421 RepID=UPI0037844740
MRINALKINWHPMRAAMGRMFNLNDSRWGRGDDPKSDAGKPEQDPADNQPPRPPYQNNGPTSGRRGGANAGPPDLDELWRDFNRKLSGMFGGSKPPGSGGPKGFQPDMKNAGLGLGLVAGVAALIWLGTGVFIVQEGQQAVITQFGRYHTTIVNAGVNWRLPYPIQRHELVFVTQIRSVDVGRDSIMSVTGLKDSSMLTQDQNIVDVKFSVQYRLNDARAFLFESKNPGEAVVQAAESSVREVMGRTNMDEALTRNTIVPQVRELMQTILDRYNVGVEIVEINLQQGGVRPPEQVQAAFDDVNKAGQERERAKNEAEAYANDVIPRAVGSASRLQQEADAYKARVVAQAQGDAQRFRSVLAEYQKAPQVTRDRMYLDAMQQIYTNVTKVLVESRQGSSLLYLPLEKILQAGASPQGEALGTAVPGSTVIPAQPAAAGTVDARSRDAARTRERETR